MDGFDFTTKRYHWKEQPFTQITCCRHGHLPHFALRVASVFWGEGPGGNRAQVATFEDKPIHVNHGPLHWCCPARVLLCLRTRRWEPCWRSSGLWPISTISLNLGLLGNRPLDGSFNFAFLLGCFARKSMVPVLFPWRTAKSRDSWLCFLVKAQLAGCRRVAWNVMLYFLDWFLV